MIVFLNKDLVGFMGVVFLIGGVIWWIFGMLVDSSDANDLSNAKKNDQARMLQIKSKNYEKFTILTSEVYSEFQGSVDFIFPDDERLEKFLHLNLIWFGVGIFDKRQIVGKQFNEIQNYVISRVNAYIS